MAKNKEEKKNKKLNPFVRIIFVFILPLIVAIVLAVFVLSFVGIDVVGWSKDKAQNIPVISSFIKTDEEKELNNKLDRANETISSQQELIDDLKQEVESLKAIRDDNELEIKKMQNELQSENATQNTDAVIEEDLDAKKLAGSFRKMDKEQAAKIVESMDLSTAILLLSNVSGTVRGEILEKMDPKIAANIMENMVD